MALEDVPSRLARKDIYRLYDAAVSSLDMGARVTLWEEMAGLKERMRKGDPNVVPEGRYFIASRDVGMKPRYLAVAKDDEEALQSPLLPLYAYLAIASASNRKNPDEVLVEAVKTAKDLLKAWR